MNKTVSSTEKWIEKDRRVWVNAKPNLPNPESSAFLQAKVINVLPKQIVVVLRQQDQDPNSYTLKEYNVSYDDCQKLTYGPSDVSDMVDLEQLNEPELLYNLYRRYMNDSIFTYCGPTLVIINPYAFVEKLFNDQLMLEYQMNVFLDNLEYKTMPPHVFSLAAFCLWQLFDNLRNQSIVISGESGAGKTENTKYCLKFLASLGKNMKALTGDRAQRIISSRAIRNLNRNSKLKGIEDKILGCNQILQAFGNAKTIRNDNSSRFGKLILLLYGESQTDIKSAFIISYLLQKSRVVSIAQGERNYHVFYYFMKGTSPQQKKAYFLTKPIHQYKYINQSSVFGVPGINDQKKYAEVQVEFQNYFSPEQTHCIFTIIASVLNLGNLTFKKELSKNNEEMAIIVNKEYLFNVAELLGIKQEELDACFQFKTRKIGGSVINSPLRYDEAIALQNSFAKNLYERIFLYLVIKLNQKIQLEKVNLQQTTKGFRKSIGLLDIFGFQVLQINSLQQFFINFANEKLQQLYVSYIFKEQQNEFLRQGLKQFSHDIGFQDNKPVIDLFELQPIGIFYLINESSELNSPDENLPESIVRSHPKNHFVQIPKSKRGVFMISHSCSPVNYHTAGFASRNKDEFPAQLREAVERGSNEVLKLIIQGAITNKPQAKTRTAATKFLGSKFLNDMNKLTEELYASDCHFVRCIKPNSKKAPKTFNSEAVLQSLRYLGVLDSILIRKLGYIYRRPFKEFVRKFFQIQQYSYGWNNFMEGKTEQDFKDYSKNFILKYAPNEFANREVLLGHKKVLIKESALNHLQAMAKQKRKMRIQCANKIKQMYVKHVFRRKAHNLFKCVANFKGHMVHLVTLMRAKIMNRNCAKVQKVVKKYVLYIRVKKIEQQATKSVSRIAAYYRMRKQRTIYLALRQKIIKMQANIRFFLTMAAFIKFKNCREMAQRIFELSWKGIQHRKAVLIQKTWKGHVVRRQFKAVMEQIRRKLRLGKYRDYLMQAIFQHKYQKYLAILAHYRKPIIQLQAIVRGKFAHRTYTTMKLAATLIQKSFRRHLRKKYYLIRLWKNYRKNIYTQQKLKARELAKFCLTNHDSNNTRTKYYPETIGKIIAHYPKELLSRYGRGEEGKSDWTINESLAFHDKNTLQLYIADYDIIGTQYYSGRWLSKYAELKDEMKRRGEYPIHLSLGEEITTVLSNKERHYSFHADQFRQNTKHELGGLTNILVVADRATYSLRADGSAYVWGYNYESFIEHTPEEFIEGKEDSRLTKLKPAAMWCKGTERYVANVDGKMFRYTCDPLANQWKPTPFDIPSKQRIKSVALSYSFSIFLNDQGHLFSLGDNSKGQLGLGHTSPGQVKQPQPVTHLRQQLKQIIETVSAGMGHVVAKSKLGYVYTWGDNCFHQASPKPNKHLDTPEVLQAEDGKLKVLQAVAGMRTTYLLSESIRITATGTSSALNTPTSIHNLPLQLLRQTTNAKNLQEIKLSARWIRELSVLCVSALDLSRCKAGTKADVLLKYSKMMAKEWLDERVYPQYHEWTDNCLQLSDLRKFKFNPTSPPSNKHKSAKPQSDLEQLKALLDLRKSSTVFKRAAVQKKDEALARLRRKPEQEWTEQDRELNRFIQDNIRLLT